MKLSLCYSIFFFGWCFLSKSEAADAAPKPPNVVILLADDLGWNAVGYHNAEVKTPNIDRLCKDGVELDQFYTSPMCSPTRAGLMTGRYPIRFGCARSVIPPWRDYGVSVDEVMMPAALAAAGYGQCGAFGKWHLGHAEQKWLPLARGFTEFTGCYNGAIDYFTFEREGEVDWHHNEESIRPEGYSTTVIGDAAVNFIGKAATDEKPFLCYVPFNAPHSPFEAPESYLEKYSQIKDVKKRTYYAMITAMDDQVGRILDSIKQAGIEKNTVVWFFSDNGGVHDIKKNNAPLRGNKLTNFEGGVRTVACVRYPGVYASGKKIEQPMAFIDVLPTVMALTDHTPESAGCKPLDGVDLNPVLTGKTAELPARDLYFYHGQTGEDSETIAIHSGPWKLIVNGPSLAGDISGKHQIRLFKLAKDPNEKQELSEENPEVVERLMKKLVTFRKLQPADAIPPYDVGKKGFVAPKDWKITKK
ncbi:sulfatase-like hydrolase/transferase [Luteolibacter pohnpeiensis]|uniref:Sulfatase-like hydrolase/transferase n=1 Tax=Luteolibacter pohnpeiensis TaxID=454153 RepID=A0A934S5E7_9BACT|nr:sulfatase-like hydrolase/transferase [Luteolibacter pohnpeiensis]MBK1882587.1 sulfatase-like hydrolase/transferase [Luteolibacter pohnpeiensis]